jgi:aminoglycoside/choline kinase family phosphotransferase
MNERSLLLKQYKALTGEEPLDIIRMPRSGSNRVYSRIIEKRRTIVAAYNPNPEENRSFIGFSEHFASKNLPVPSIYNFWPDVNVYFLQDLGDTNLFTWLERKKQLHGFDEEVVNFYRKSLDMLVEFQVRGIEGLDLDLCYPHRSFDRQSMMWDLNYFKYMFLKLVSVEFNEKRLEKDFNVLADFLLEAGQKYFLYRDFQSANIMVVDREPWFIDYQGGRLGAAQYDPVSLLFDSKAHIPQQIREILLEHYIERFCEVTGEDESQFRTYIPGFILIRIMQALGAYGYRGLYEQKPGFVQSILPAVRDFTGVIESGALSIKLPELFGVIEKISSTSRFDVLQEPEMLTITISSFSYMYGIPSDSIHGGGFVFDCRGLVNPGKVAEYRDMTGKDTVVADYMMLSPDTEEFTDDALSIVKRSIKSYKKKNYTSLSVSFGCTGGQHRSVYCAETIAEGLRSMPGIEVVLNHRDIQE